MPAAQVPQTSSLAVLKEGVQHCRACDLYRNATQAVFGGGARNARIVAVGEQPGDYEDKDGRPFVGPAGKVLDRAFEDAGVSRCDVYVTNAVKHFKFEPRGKRRIHKKPNTAEIPACRPWLEAEVACVTPELIVALGATAVQSLLLKKARITPLRGKFMEHPWAKALFITIHPSAILRTQSSEDRARGYAHFVQDLKAVAGWLRHRSAA